MLLNILNENGTAATHTPEASNSFKKEGTARRRDMRVLWATVISAALLALTQATPAQTYPVKPVRYLIPFSAGDSPDIVGRLLSERLNRLWGQAVVVENRVGAGGTVGAAVAAKAAP